VITKQKNARATISVARSYALWDKTHRLFIHYWHFFWQNPNQMMSV
jgi:hypothetical protein